MDGAKRKYKQTNKYIAIVKIKNLPNGKAYCVKYRFNDLLKFTVFLDNKWPQWKWYNLYHNKGENKGIQIGSYTRNKRTTSRHV